MIKKWFEKFLFFVLLVMLTACNLPATGGTTTTSVESRITQAWEECVNAVGELTHVCNYNKLSNFSEATTVEAGFTIAPNTIILVNDYFKGSNPFIVNGNQSATEGTDFQRISGAYTGLVSVYYTNTTLVMSTSGKQILLNQSANPYVLFPGWPSWPPVLPTQMVIQTAGPVDSTATPNIIPPAFSSKDFFNIWYSQTPNTSLIGLLDEAYAKWSIYGGEFTATTYSFVRAGTIVWPVDPSNITDLSKQPFDPYNQSCFSTFNEANTVIYTVCDIYVVNPPFKYLTVSDSKDFQLGMLPAVPVGIHP